MRPVLRFLLCAATAFALAGFPVAQAAPQEEAAATAREQQAVALFRQANDAYKEDRYEEAARLFEQAWQLAETYDIAANYGHTAFQLGDYRKAAELLSFALARWPQTGQTTAKQATVERLAEARRHVGTLRVTVRTAGARILLDGAEVGSAPLDRDLFVEPGPHVVQAELQGYQPARVELDAAAGATARAELELQAVAAPTDGGTPPDEADGPSLAAPIVLGAVGLVAAGVGIGLMVAATGKGSDADDQLGVLQADVGDPNPCHELSPYAGTADCSSITELREQHDTLHNVGLWTTIIGGLALATSAVWLGVELGDEGTGGDTTPASADDPGPRTAISVLPWLSPSPMGRAGLMVQGRY